jgi:LPS-assembly lipoprotein
MVFTAGLLVSACGFSPLYATNNSGTGVVSKLAAIAVVAPDDALNRTLRLSLEDLLRSEGASAPQYQVIISSQLSERSVAIQQDTSVTRKNILLTALYNLVDLESGETVYKSEATSIATYNRVNSEFANIIAERDARDRAALQTAEQIRTSLAVFFERQNGQ